MGLIKRLFTNCACPQGRMGRAMLKFMNLCHAPLKNWGLKHIDIQDGWTMLDIGCGGGATLQRLLKHFLSSKFFRKKNTKSSNFILSISAKFSNSFLRRVQNIFIVRHLLITQRGRCVHMSGTSPLGTRKMQKIRSTTPKILKISIVELSFFHSFAYFTNRSWMIQYVRLPRRYQIE